MRISNTVSLLAAAALFGAEEAFSSESPSSQPSSQPSQTSSPKPWDVEFLGLNVDFSVDSNDELVVSYSIGKNRVYESELLAKDCVSSITGVGITMVPSRPPKDATRDLLSLAYSIDKSTIADSNIWNDTSNKIEVCQVVQLVVPSAGQRPRMVITEDKRKLNIDLDLFVDFAINDKDLGEANIYSEDGSTNVTSYVESCKCGGVQDFSCNSSPLLPNNDLFVCIKSVSSDVTIDFLDSISVTQGATTLAFIEDDVIIFPSITSREYVSAENGVVVSTRVPLNLFNYSVGESITITGEIGMQLAGSGRKLRAVTEGVKADDNEIASSFELEIALQQEIVYDDDNSSINSANSVASKNLGMFGMAFAFAYTMW